MTFLKGKGTGRVLKILGSALVSLMVLKGWALFSLIGGSGDESGLAGVVSEGTAVAAVSDGYGDVMEENGCPNYMDRLIKEIEQEKERLKMQALRLEEKDRNLQAYDSEIKGRMEQLSRIREEILTMYQQIEDGQKEQELKLVKIYESMEPESAAQRIELMSDELGAKLLIRMNPRSSGQILGIMSSQKASRLTKLLSEKRKKDKEAAASSGAGQARAGEPEIKVGSMYRPEELQPKALPENPEEAAKKNPARSAGDKDQNPLAEMTATSRVFQLGAFREREHADNLVRDLKKKGYASFNQPSPNEGYYRVFVGPFNDQAQAQKVRTQLETEEGFKGLILKTGREIGV